MPILAKRDDVRREGQRSLKINKIQIKGLEKGQHSSRPVKAGNDGLQTGSRLGLVRASRVPSRASGAAHL